MAPRFALLHRLVIGLTCLSLTLVACGDSPATLETPPSDGGGTGLGGSTGQPGDTTFADDLATNLCDWMLGCCTTTEVEDFVAAMATIPSDAETVALALTLSDDPATCHELVKGFVIDTLRHADAAVLSGRAAFDEAGAASCLAHFDEGCGVGGAEDIASADHPCSTTQIVTGLVAADGLCTDHFECQGSAYCDVDLGATFGTCRSYAPPKSPCKDDSACGPTGYCAAPGSLGICAPAGGSLAPYCNTHADCGGGQYCATAIGSCVSALATGSVCQGNVYCSTDYCALASTQVCEETKGLNELCSADAACGPAGFCDGSAPDVHRCVSLTKLGIGERCDVGAAICGDGLVCEEGLCVQRSGLGGPCQNDAYCPSSGWCDAGSCSQRSPVGGMCTSDSQCVAISWCKSGTCTQRVELNQSCDQNDRCAEGAFCNFEVGVIGTCQSLPAAGSDCIQGACSPGLTCATYEGTCAARLEADANCGRTAMCSVDHLCASAGLLSNVCQAPAVVGAGEPCYTASATCGSGLYCDGAVCTAYAVAGAPCSGDDACVAGTSCVQGSCNTLGGAFATCDSLEDCSSGLYCDMAVQQCNPQKTKDQSCMADSECQGTLFCDTTSWLCDWKKANSEPCSNHGQCQDGLYCNLAGSCDTRLGAGQTCNVDDACLDGLSCIGGLCTAPASPGTTCDPILGCAEGSVCDGATNLCVSLSTLGQACDADNDCTSDLYCSEVGSTCAPRAEKGEACGDSDGCLPSLTCQQSGLCRLRSAVGDACDPVESQCTDGALCDASGICVGLLADRSIGSPCRHHAQCQSLTCESGLCVGHCQGDN